MAAKSGSCWREWYRIKSRWFEKDIKILSVAGLLGLFHEGFGVWIQGFGSCVPDADAVLRRDADDSVQQHVVSHQSVDPIRLRWTRIAITLKGCSHRTKTNTKEIPNLIVSFSTSNLQRDLNWTIKACSHIQIFSSSPKFCVDCLVFFGGGGGCMATNGGFTLHRFFWLNGSKTHPAHESPHYHYTLFTCTDNDPVTGNVKFWVVQ